MYILWPVVTDLFFSLRQFLVRDNIWSHIPGYLFPRLPPVEDFVLCLLEVLRKSHPLFWQCIKKQVD